MNIYKKFYFFAVLIFGHVFMQVTLLASNLDGTTSLVYKNQHHVFSNGESARGFVRMNGGFTIKPAAKATLDTVVTVSGAIDLRETGTMQLISDLKLDYGITWSSGGYINGRGKTLILNGPLTIPASKIIHVTGDTIINGNKNNLILNENTQIVVENNATLTLRNIFIKNVRNNPSSPCIQIASHSAKLALDNTDLAITGDMNFSRGKLYIHNDVIFSGTSALIYTSTQSSYIAPSSTLFFDIGTTFSFAPSSTSNELFVLQDRTSSLFLNGASLKITSTGMRMTKGNLLLDNKILLSARDYFTTVTGLTALTSQDYGSGILSVAWNSAGTVLAIGGGVPVNGAGGFANTDELRLYSFDGSTLTALTSQDYGTQIYSLAWNPTGTVLAIGGVNPVNGAGGFANTDELRLYSFNGSTLTALTSQDYGDGILSVAWNPAGTVLAIGGNGPVNGAGGFANTDELRLYSFDGSTLTALTSQNYGGPASYIYSLAWNPAGTVLAIGGQNPSSGAGGFANTDELRLYSFNGSTLTALTSQDYGNRIRFLAWNPAGTVLAIGGEVPVNGAGGFANTDEVRLYSFNGSTLTALTSQDYGGFVNAFAWNPAGTVLAIGGWNPTNGAGGFADTNELRLYSFNGSTLTALISQDYGSFVLTLALNPSGTVLAVGGENPTNGAGGFANTDELRLYDVDGYTISLISSAANSLIFGNSSLGSNYDLNVEVLGGAHVIVEGNIVDDSA